MAMGFGECPGHPMMLVVSLTGLRDPALGISR